MEALPLKVDELKVGLFIKLDHPWSEHPFLRTSFRIKSANEIAIIRKHNLNKLFYDPQKSDPEALKQLESPCQEQVDDEKAFDLQAAEEEEALKKEKQERIKIINRRRDKLKQTEQAYASATGQCKEMFTLILAGHQEGFDIAEQLVESIIDALLEDAASTLLVSQFNSSDTSNKLLLHSLNVCVLSMMVGREFDLSRNDLFRIGLGALLHDIGKKRLPSSIHSKKSPLNRDDAQMMKLHTEYSKNMLERSHIFPTASADLIYQHHERLDGSGYPQGLTDDKISFFPKIVMVVDEYDYLTNSGDDARCYTATEALSHLYVKMQDKFARDVITTFICTMTVYPPGTIVQLTDGSIGLVVSTNRQDRMKPLVMLYEPGVSRDEAIIADLAQDEEMVISQSLHPREISQRIMTHLNPSCMNGYFVCSLK